MLPGKPTDSRMMWISMGRLKLFVLAVVVLSASVACAAPADPNGSPGSSPPTGIDESAEPVFETFDPADFDQSAQIDNPWMPMSPGTQWVYEGTTTEEGSVSAHRIEFTATDLVKHIEGVDTLVAWIADYADGELVEKEIAFYAQDEAGNVWYFGEHPEEFAGGEFVAAPTWIAGIDGARAGIKMRPDPEPGMPSYYQGWGPAVEWSDYGTVDQIGQESCVPVGCYDDVLVIAESSLGEEGAFQLKYYAREVGEIRVGWKGDDSTFEELELVEQRRLTPEELGTIRAEALALEAHAYEISADVYASTAPSQQRGDP